MSNKSKEKGKTFEREACQMLKDAFRLSFNRVPNSGAFVGGMNAARMESMSDNQINNLIHCQINN